MISLALLRKRLRRLSPGSRITCGVWCVVCGVWCVVCGVWCMMRELCVVRGSFRRVQEPRNTHGHTHTHTHTYTYIHIHTHHLWARVLEALVEVFELSMERLENQHLCVHVGEWACVVCARARECVYVMCVCMLRASPDAAAPCARGPW